LRALRPDILCAHILFAKPTVGESIHLDSSHLQNSFQVFVAEKFDFNRAPAFMVTERHLGAETFLDFVLHRRDMGVLTLQDGASLGSVLMARLGL
jgi:hypothetical protein